MEIREWNHEDNDAVRRIHEAMMLGYGFPNADNPLFVLKKVAEDENGIAAAGAVRLMGEAFLWLSPGLETKEKKGVMHSLSAEMREAAVKLGLDELSAWIPPRIEMGFAPELREMRWYRSPWPSWSTRL